MKFLFIVLALVLCVSAASAQELNAGSRVRVTLLAHPEAPMVGILLAFRADSLAFASEPDSVRRAYALAEIGRLERSTGMHSNATKGAVIGAVAGGVAAGLLGALFASAIKEGDTEAIPIVLGAGGAVVGGLVGAAIGEGSKHEKWEQVRP
jgi:purine-cytosine permease-like protein